MNERQGFFCIRGSDLDRMDPSDFKAIEAWFEEATIQPPKKKPLPHQEEALADIVPTLQKEDRATAIMACGTGKTLVTLWTAEQLEAQKILVLLPSLALLRQTLHEWLKETSLNVAYHCVCSDPTVKGDADAISTAQSDLDFEVSTNPETVRRFLDATFKGTKVIFSTYQSASVVGQALRPGEAFDLGIFDEAHKTAGREGRKYGFALDDKNLPIAKRLFVTATPRHYNPSKRNKEGDATVAFSMDDPKIYGKQCHTLSFSKAANLGIICGYKVIISVITSDQVTDELLSKGLVTVKGDDIRARQVANQIALRDAVAQYGVSKIFTFHSTVKSAASFVADGSEGVRTHLPEFAALHVSGAMPMARRERVMKEFQAAPRAVMSNARCLTEGVDVPSVDMVGFLSPRKSKVDIVQAIGRAMRRSGSKEVGYVLIPLYLEQKAGESIEEAVARANFEEVWDILQSLQEQDEVLADAIKDAAQAKGRDKGFDDSRFSDLIAFTGPLLALESIRQAVITKVLERLESSWDVNFGKLVKFKEEHGHSRVPQFYKPNTALGRWLHRQRQNYVNGTLSIERTSSLNSLDVDWDPLSSRWDSLFNDLSSYKEIHGHCNIPQKNNTHKELGCWVAVQRTNQAKGKLSKERLALLDSIGFVWDPHISLWEKQFLALQEYHLNHGHCRVSITYKTHRRLGHWVNFQRQMHSKGKLSVDRITRLEKLGFEWDPFIVDWEIQFEALIAYHSRHGHCRVPATSKDFKQLASWIRTQRKRYLLGKLLKEQITRLEAIQFDWDPYNSLWENKFKTLEIFKTKHGHCRVPLSDKVLGNWFMVQRRNYSKGQLSPDRIARLEALGFEWKVV
jgi:superfamily II DNA or RNA helicase